MEYFKVRWNHKFSDEPVVLLHEVNDDRFELRQIHIFRDGRKSFASQNECNEYGLLSDVSLPSLYEIAMNREFEPESISKFEFEQEWSNRFNNE